MKACSKINSQSVVFLAILSCLMIAGSTSALAVPPTEVARTLTNQAILGKCCVLFGPQTRVTEPTAVVPVVVTWSTDYQDSNEWILSGLSLNGRPCSFFGSGSFPVFNVTDQWRVPRMSGSPFPVTV